MGIVSRMMKVRKMMNSLIRVLTKMEMKKNWSMMMRRMRRRKRWKSLLQLIKLGFTLVAVRPYPSLINMRKLVETPKHISIFQSASTG